MYHDLTQFEGYFKNGVRHGKGLLSYPVSLWMLEEKETARRSLAAEWYKGQIISEVKLTFENGAIFYGNLDRSMKMTGFGKIIYPAEDLRYNYTGHFAQNYFHGKGQLFYKSGRNYQGQFLKGKKSGQGKITFSFEEEKKTINKDKISITGQFIDDKLILTKISCVYRNLASYIGGFDVLHRRTGFGYMKYHETSKFAYYRGYFARNLRHGAGKLVFKNGGVYSGKFADNYMTGYGEYLFPEIDKHGQKNLKESYAGNWYKNKYQGQGKFTWTNGEFYTGMFYAGLQNGKGRHYLTANDAQGRKYYEGDWHLGKLDGEIKLVMKDGSYYMKEFEKGVEIPEQTVLYDKYGRVISDEFKRRAIDVQKAQEDTLRSHGKNYLIQFNGYPKELRDPAHDGIDDRPENLSNLKFCGLRCGCF